MDRHSSFIFHGGTYDSEGVTITYSQPRSPPGASNEIPGNRFPRENPKAIDSDLVSNISYTTSTRAKKLAKAVETIIPNSDTDKWVVLLREAVAAALTHAFFIDDYHLNGIWTGNTRRHSERAGMVSGTLLSILQAHTRFSKGENLLLIDHVTKEQLEHLDHVVDEDMGRSLLAICKVAKRVLDDRFKVKGGIHPGLMGESDVQNIRLAMAQSFVLGRTISPEHLEDRGKVESVWPWGLHAVQNIGTDKQIAIPFLNEIIMTTYEEAFYGHEFSIARTMFLIYEKYPDLYAINSGNEPWKEEGSYSAYCLVIVAITLAVYNVINEDDEPLDSYEEGYKSLLQLLPTITVSRPGPSGVSEGVTVERIVKDIVKGVAKRKWEDLKKDVTV